MSLPPTVESLLATARKRLAQAPFRPSGREAALLLGHVLDLSEAQLYARGLDPVAEAPASTFETLLNRRLLGEPVAHLLGEREFYGRPFYVDSRVLIPRPETEHLIETALTLNLPGEARVLDIGTGSGCIAVTLALELPGARVFASDLSLSALQIFAANCRRHDAAVPAVRGDLGLPLDLGSVDLLVSNPPYVEPQADISHEVRGFEPHLALFPPGDDGRGILRRLFRQCARLRPGAHALFEIGYDQGDWVRQSVSEMPWLELLDLVPDLAGIERVAHLLRSGHATLTADS